MKRRNVLVAFASGMTATTGFGFPVCTDRENEVCNVTRLYSAQMQKLVVIRDIQDIQRVLKSDLSKISIGGGRYSMGGQTAITGGVQVDMRSLNRLLWLKASQKLVRVQAGMRWRDLQEILDPVGLSVQTMQSYANFTVGGSVSVNCHGRYIGHGPIINSIRSMQLVLPDGQVLEVNRNNNTELFHAAVGGYGAVGVVTEVELFVDENFAIERNSQSIPINDYADWFQEKIQKDESVLLHNADLTLPYFDRPFAVTWRRTSKSVNVSQHLRPQGKKDAVMQTGIWAMTELPQGHRLRSIAQESQKSPMVVWRNYEASLDISELEPITRRFSTYVLQEYFVPVSNFSAYVRELSKLMQEGGHHTLNISIRHSKADKNSLMSWAHEDVFCFVVYYKQRMNSNSEMPVQQWTRAMIDLALRHGGTYYLPYQPHATQEQFEQAYPNVQTLRKLRKTLGAARMSNMMWERYQV